MDLTALFGNDIKVAAQPRIAQRQYHGYPGADGLTAMWMGLRGYQIIVTGRLVATGNSYAQARSVMQGYIDAIEDYMSLLPTTYTYMGCTYLYVVFEKFQLIPGAEGKYFHWCHPGNVTCNFVAELRSLL